MTTTTQPPTVADLRPGDRLHTIGGIGFGTYLNADAPPVLVCEVRHPAPDAADQIAAITTSAGLLYAHLDAAVTHTPDPGLTDSSVLLIGRRASLHTTLLAYGVPIVRRTPTTATTTTPAVTAQEWTSARLIIIDGHLSQQTLRAMRERGDLPDRPGRLLVGTDPDDARVYGRARCAHAAHALVMPYDAALLGRIMRAATGSDTDDDLPDALAPLRIHPTRDPR